MPELFCPLLRVVQSWDMKCLFSGVTFSKWNSQIKALLAVLQSLELFILNQEVILVNVISVRQQQNLA